MTASIAVLMGGISPEHPVSLASGCGVLAELDPGRYRGFPVLISRANEWMWPAAAAAGAWTPPEGWNADAAAAILADPPEGWVRIRFPRFSEWPPAEVFFLALHGAGGEDGRIQGFLEMAGQPFTGSGSLGSAIAMDKILTKQTYARNGIPTAPWIVLTPEQFGESGADCVEEGIGLPAVVKDPGGGSSIGVSVVRTRADLVQALEELGKDATRLLVEAFLPGREASCGVLEGFGSALAPTEIRPRKAEFFSFEEKYRQDGAEEITPAPFPAEVTAEMQALAARAHQALRLSVYSRTDFIWNHAGDDPEPARIFALETNNLPGFTPTSLLPQQARHAGLSYRDLVTQVIEESRRRWRPS